MKALVTGGGGYLGGAIVRALIDRGDEVSSLQRGTYPELEQLGVQTHTGDMTNPDEVIKASKDCDIIFHVAGKTGVWGDFHDYFNTNVTGTESVITACLENKISRLVYTSSPSVIFNGKDEENVNESIPYPDHYFNHYQTTKAIAERKVLAANRDGLATIALRPHLIWGQGDPHLIGRIVERAKTGKLKLVKGHSLVDTTYIDNSVSAHLLAADALQPGAACAGKTYFISDGEPVSIADFINRILATVDFPPITQTISPGLAYFIGATSEIIYELLGLKREPMMTRFIAKQLSCAHWYDISAAKRDFGYQPIVSIEEGLKRLQ